MEKRNSKVLGIRLDKELFKDFERACENLPLALKPQEILKAYIRSIVDISKNINNDTIHLSRKGNNLIIIDNESSFEKLHVTRGGFDVNFR